MSNTFKDRPYWVRSNDPSERRDADHDHRGGVCTIDEPVTRDNQYGTWCAYSATEYSQHGDGPTREYVRAVWWGPERARTRDACRLLATQYNTTGDVNEDDEPTGVQHRGSAKWIWF